MKFQKFILFFAVCLIVTGCGGGSSSGSNGGVKSTLVVTKLSSKVTAPALITVSMKVDTSAGKPVPYLKKENFTLLEDSQAISNTESSYTVVPVKQDFIFNVLLLLDLSGSVVTGDLQALKEDSKAFIDKVFSTNQGLAVKIGYFDGNASYHSLSTDFSSSPGDLKNVIDSIAPDISNDNSTNLNGAVVDGAATVRKKISDDITANPNLLSEGALVIFTDGRDRANRVTDQTAIDSATGANSTSLKNISVFTIGLGQEIDPAVLKAIGKDGFQAADNISALEEAFRGVADLLSNEAQSYYILKYCSPLRGDAIVNSSSLGNDLQITVTNNGISGSTSTTYSAVTFTGGCTTN